MEDNKYQELTPGQMLLDAVGEEYELLPEGEPLKFHIDKVTTTQGKNYNTGEAEQKLVLGFQLDEDIPGKGQVYSQWFKPSIAERANLTKVLKAVFGSVPTPFDPTSLVGMPLQGIMVNKVKDGSTRQYVDTFLKPAVGQKKVQQDKDVVLEDISDEPVDLDSIEF